jgi:hypothetical protein
VEPEKIAACEKEIEVADTLTKTQEIYVYNKTPEESPKGFQQSPHANRACDEVSFAAEVAGSVVIHGSGSASEKACELASPKKEDFCPASAEATDADKDIAQLLVDAVEEKNLEALCEAIRRAMLAGASPDLIEWAHGKREVLEEQSWNTNMHRAAEQTLQEALRGTSTEFLKSAFERAESLGLQGTLFTLFNQAREELQRRQARQNAEEGLYAALHGVTIGTPCIGLADAIDRAADAGVSAELVSHARRRLTEVKQFTCSRQASCAAEQKLEELTKTCNDASTLTAALESAQEAGVSLKVIDSARKRKGVLEEQAWHRDLADHRPASNKDELEEPAWHPVRELADHRPEAALSAKEIATSSGCTTPASTVGVLREREVREEAELLDLMHMPTRTLDAEDAPSPIQMADHVSPPQSDNTASMHLPSLDVAPEPASEPTVTAEASLEITPRSVRGQVNQSDEISNTTRTPVRTSLAEEAPLPAPRSSWRPSVMSHDAPPIYGLDAELKAKAEANYDTVAEQQAAQWVQDITGVQVVGEFGEALRTGQVLCQLVNCIKPGSIAKINGAGMPFKERENITKFLKVCRSWGLHEYALFSTDDLYDEKNLLSVVKCLHQLGGALSRAVPEFQGPHLGIADTSKAKRDQKREFEPVSQTGGLHAAMARSHIDVMSNCNVKHPNRGGC